MRESTSSGMNARFPTWQWFFPPTASNEADQKPCRAANTRRCLYLYLSIYIYILHQQAVSTHTPQTQSSTIIDFSLTSKAGNGHVTIGNSHLGCLKLCDCWALPTEPTTVALFTLGIDQHYLVGGLFPIYGKTCSKRPISHAKIGMLPKSWHSSVLIHFGSKALSKRHPSRWEHLGMVTSRKQTRLSLS